MTSSGNYKEKNIVLIKNTVKKLMAQNKARIAILPMGFWGETAKDILEKEFHIKPTACFDNYSFNGRDVFSIDSIKNIILPKTTILVVVENEGIRAALYQQIVSDVPDPFIELISLHNEEQEKVLENPEKVHLDFLCVGFHKCGTTSLHVALQQNEHIFLPYVKENFFATDITECGGKMLRQHYPQESVKKDSALAVGGIEPTYASCADSVSGYFGTDIKILFCVRNPVRVLKSCFKMAMREVDGSGFPLIKKYGAICPELMREFIEENYRRFIYVDFIRMYERYYSVPNIKIVIAEELIKDPQTQMDEIQAFIGLPEKYRRNYENFPHENKGDTVFKSIGSAYVNDALNRLRMQVKDAELYAEINEVRKQVLNITTVPFDFGQYEDIWQPVWGYYVDSVKNLEDRIGRSLKGIWY